MKKQPSPEPTRSPRRKRAPRFVDIAAEAGVSEATVDRVLNERGSVSAAARERVVAAATRLGVARLLPDVRHGLMHVDILMPLNHTPFYRRLDLALQRAIDSVERRIVVHRLHVGEQRDEDYARAILLPPYPRAGLIIAAPSSPRTIAALQVVAARGEPVVTMVSDVPEVASRIYVGVDNYGAGRTAGHVLGRRIGGKGNVLVLPALRSYRAHTERAQGCCDELAEFFPDCRVIMPDADTVDDPSACYRIVQRAIRKQRIAAIYNTGDGAQGIEAALDEAGLTGRMAWAGHEIDDMHRRLLAERKMDMAIDQDPDGQAFSALQRLLSLAGQNTASVPSFRGEFMVFLPTHIRGSGYFARAHLL
jgi:LacI family transcriptional regulator